jgi:DNA-directed RNA polymerase subunit E'/Rpb7
MTKQIKQNISIESRYLDSDIQNHVFNKLKKNMEGKCTFDDGYIIEVKKIINLGNNHIGCTDSLTVFNVLYEADVLKPEKGDIFVGKVCMIFQHGIFVDIKGKMKVLIPSNSINTYVYNQNDNIFENSDNSIKNGIEVSIEITMTKYEKKQYSCIGNLVKINI